MTADTRDHPLEGAGAAGAPEVDWTAMLDLLPDAALLLDGKARIRRANTHAARLARVDRPEGLIGLPVDQVLELDGSTRGAATALHLGAGGTERNLPATLRCPDGTAVPVEISVSDFDQCGGECSALILVRDASGRQAAEAALRAGESYLASIFDLAPIGMAVADMEGYLVKTNRALQTMLGFEPGELDGMHWTRIVHPDDIAAEEVLDDQLVAGEIDQYTLESRHLCRNGEAIWTRQTVAEVRNEQGEAVFGIAMIEDITERRAMEQALTHQALHDALTGLPNRALFRDRAEHALQAAVRGARPLAMLLLDLDRFKELNDTYGHHHGDLLLQQVGGRLSRLLRPADTLARLGGDEFAVLLPDGDERAAQRVAARIRRSLTQPFPLEDLSFVVDASVGIALYPEHGEDMTTLLRHADIAMYTAKRTSSAVEVYSPDQELRRPRPPRHRPPPAAEQ